MTATCTCSRDYKESNPGFGCELNVKGAIFVGTALGVEKFIYDLHLKFFSCLNANIKISYDYVLNITGTLICL